MKKALGLVAAWVVIAVVLHAITAAKTSLPSTPPPPPVVLRPVTPTSPRPASYPPFPVSDGRIWATGGGSMVLSAPPGQRWVEAEAEFVAPQFPAGSDTSIWVGIQSAHSLPCAKEGCLVQAGIATPSIQPTWTEDLPRLSVTRPLAWRAGQTIQVVIQRIKPGKWWVEIRNVSTGASWSGDEKWSCGDCQVAETAVESWPGTTLLSQAVRWISDWAVSSVGQKWEIR